MSNAKPTACLHQVLQENGVSPSSLPSIEELLRNVILRFFRLKTDIEQCTLSLDAFRDLYTSRWLHSGQLVTVKQPNGTQLTNCEINGLDDFGYLWVESKESGQRFSIQPDGNTFDMMANLIKPKWGCEVCGLVGNLCHKYMQQRTKSISQNVSNSSFLSLLLLIDRLKSTWGFSYLLSFCFSEKYISIDESNSFLESERSFHGISEFGCGLWSCVNFPRNLISYLQF